MSSSLFAGPSSASDQEDKHETLFSQLKPVCVPLLAAARRPDSPAIRKELSQLLDRLSLVLRDASSQEFSENLANYVLFPLTPLFNADRGDVILDKTFTCLKRIVQLWSTVGIPDKVVKELWTLAVLKVGGPMGQSKDDKGKGKADMSEETQFAIMSMLHSLLDAYRSAKTQRDKKQADYLNWMDSSEHVGQDGAPSKAVLFHSLSTVLEIASNPTSLVDLQLVALSVLRRLVPFFCDDTPNDRIPSMGATILPGTLSKLSKIALNMTSHSGRRHAIKVSCRAIQGIGDLITDIVGNFRTASLVNRGQPVLESLESLELAAPETLSTVNGDTASENGTPATSGLVKPDRSWLEYTMRNIDALLKLLFPLMSHDDPAIRLATALTFQQLLSQAGEAFYRCSGLSTLIDGLSLMFRDEREDVKSAALETADLTSTLAEAVQNTFLPILETRLASLPRSIRTLASKSVSTNSRIVAAVLDVIPTTLNILSNFDRFLWPILNTCDFETPSSSMAWSLVNKSEWPTLELRNVEDKGARQDLEAAFEALGKWSCRTQKQSELCELLIGLANGPISKSHSTASLWVLDQVVKGLDSTKRSRKAVKAVTRSIIEVLKAVSEDSHKEGQNAEKSGELSDSDSLVAITKGVATLSSLDALSPVVATQSDAPRTLLTQCLALRLLATCAAQLEDDFQPFLLEATYYVLASTSSKWPVLAAHGTAALEAISYHTSYASPVNLVIANVDYVFNSVSLRLAPSRLDLSAPAVLREMIKLGGSEILPMVEDVILDVLDMIDDYHGYELLCQELWTVLDAVISVMPAEANPNQPARLLKQRETAADQFRAWYEASFSEDGGVEEVSEINPQRPFESSFPTEEEPQEPGFPTTEADEAKVSPSLAESLCIKILSKSVYFLTHSSPVLRARILRLMAMAVPILSSGPSTNDSLTRGRQGELLPAIDKAWPYVLLRIQDNTSPPVVLAAVELIAQLARYAGPFMSRRIMDDVWPLFKRLTVSMQSRDARVYSAHSNGQTQVPQTWASKVVHSMCEAIVDVARTVPLKEEVVWDIAVSMRSFVSNRIPEIRNDVEKVYVELWENANADIVWAVLTASVEEMKGGEWLLMEKEADKQVLRNILHRLLH